MTVLAGVELESLVSEPDALTTRPPPCAVCVSFDFGFTLLYIDFLETKNCKTR